MQNKILVIQQYFGAGDAIWGQTIANDFVNDGYKVIWPIMPALVEGFNYAYPKVTFIDYNLVKVNYENKEFKETDGILMLPMRYSESLMQKPYRYHMESKYSFLGKDWRTWKDHAMPVRYSGKEKELAKHLGIVEGEKYNFIATTFGSAGARQIEIKVSNEFKNIELSFIPGYSLFDWCGIIENAETIHAVSSSTLYLFELLELKATEVHLYPRVPIEKNFLYVEFLFTKPYILHK